jgi:hypothetical protein
VTSCLSSLGHAAPPLIVAPPSKGSGQELSAGPRGRFFISTAERRWVTRATICGVGGLFCEWLQPRRVDLGPQTKPAILVMDNIPTRLRGLRRHCALTTRTC